MQITSVVMFKKFQTDCCKVSLLREAETPLSLGIKSLVELLHLFLFNYNKQKQNRSNLINKRELIKMIKLHMLKIDIKLTSVYGLSVKMQHVLGNKKQSQL